MYLVRARNELPWAAMITFLPSNSLGAISSSQNGITIQTTLSIYNIDLEMSGLMRLFQKFPF
ncbi:hypothetical protein LNA01_15390 [Companilactobacillus nantensis]|nr:hypothetical protein LNA01_15390 [Companilactobacillus nantensis]